MILSVYSEKNPYKQQGMLYLHACAYVVKMPNNMIFIILLGIFVLTKELVYTILNIETLL